VRRMGTSEKLSTPPVSTAVASPARIFSAPVAMARLLEMHACTTVCDGMFVGRPTGAKGGGYQCWIHRMLVSRRRLPAAIAASRATLAVRTSWITLPPMM
jgi:hypothetical protein